MMVTQKLRAGLFVLLMLGLCALASSPAMAQTCTITNPSASYGPVDILSGAASPTTGSFTVTCTGTVGRVVRACIEIGPGVNLNGSLTQRFLDDGTNSLQHEFYTDAAHTSVWGSWGTLFAAYGSGGTTLDLTIPASGSITSAAQVVYGLVLGGQQSKPPGSYTWKGNSPGISYAYRTAGLTACPTGNKSAQQSGATDIWSATLNSNCLISSILALDFGTQGVLTANVDATTTLSVQCTNPTPYQVALGVGNGTGATIANRKMTKGAETINYTMYQNAARTTGWGQTNGTDTIGGTGTGIAQNLTVYGRIFPQTTPSAGAYTDTIIVTVTY